MHNNSFAEVLLLAKQGDPEAIEAIVEQYKELLYRKSLVDGIFDEDLYHVLIQTLLDCMETFRI